MKTKKIFYHLTATALFLPAVAAAQGLGDAASKVEEAGKIAYGEAATERQLETIIGGIIQSFLGLLGVIFLGLAIYGGYLWMTARGNEQMVEKAKNTLQAAVIGIAIVLAAYAITSFVINNLITATTGAGTAITP